MTLRRCRLTMSLNVGGEFDRGNIWAALILYTLQTFAGLLPTELARKVMSNAIGRVRLFVRPYASTLFLDQPTFDFDCLPVSEYDHSSPGTKSQSNRSIGQWSIQKYVCHKSRKNRCNAAWPDFNQQHCQQQFSNNCWDSNIFQQYCPWRPITRSIWLMSAFDRT